MRLVGIDPGLQRTGWGIVDSQGSRLSFVACGIVTSDASMSLADRLQTLFQGLRDVIDGYAPGEAAVEETVVNKNALSSLKLGHARGAAMLAASTSGLAVSEYAAKRVKRAVTGTGGASKEQVMAMIAILLPGAGAVSADAADALAVAICHAHEAATLRAMGGAVG